MLIFRLPTVTAIAIATGWLLTDVSTAATPRAGTFCLREVAERGGTPRERSIPGQAIQAFVYEGQPRSVRVTAQQIAVDYGPSGVLFDRGTGAVTGRFTVVEGWPSVRPAGFAEPARRAMDAHLVGPGVLNPWFMPSSSPPGTPGPGLDPDSSRTPIPATVAEVMFDSVRWRAIQPAGFLQKVERARPGGAVAWSDILRQLNAVSYVEVGLVPGEPPRRFTTEDGLASNIVTHFAVHDGSLWAACVDIYDPQARAWKQGGLCRYDKARGRWQQIERIDGRQVRWVTLLQTIGDELWVGFREGEDVAGDEVVYGMGLYPGTYRPKATALVLARLASGPWASFARQPRPEDADARFVSDGRQAIVPPTEHPVTLARVADKVVLFSRVQARAMGNWDVELAGHVSLLDLSAKSWQLFDPVQDLDADELKTMEVDRGEVLISSNRGVHRFDGRTNTWRFLDPHCPLRNSVFHTAAAVGEELWVGYAKHSFGIWGEQGISRFDERTSQWRYLPPTELGTASPVRRIAALANGEVWVLFGERPWLGAAMPWEFYRRESIARPAGLGRWAGGKWEFPIAGPSAGNPAHSYFGQTEDLAAIGNRLVYATAAGVFAGPPPWKQVANGQIYCVRPAKGQQAIEILRRHPGSAEQEPSKSQHGFLGLHDDRVQFQDLPNDPADPMDFYRESGGASLVASYPSAGTSWVRVPLGDQGEWLVGDFGAMNRPHGDQHGVLATATAVWVFSEGEIVRFDRRQLSELARSMAPQR
jgi:hypothetical protein